MKKLIILFLIFTLTGCSEMSKIVLEKAEITQKPVQTEEAVLPTETEEPEQTTEPEATKNEEITYIGNLNSYKFHYPSCLSVKQMNESNKDYLTCTRDEAISQGYDPCGRCNP